MTHDDEELLLRRWHAEKHAFDLWGRFICDKLTTALRGKLGDRGYSKFLKLPLTPRIKEDRSFVEKALHRKKYARPFEETEDKVAIRLVVLLEADLRIVEQVLLEEVMAWIAEKSRDHEDEISKNPYEFGYQSLHYIVRSKQGVAFDGEDLPEGMPCEIQIRTLLQHAHSELTHDTIHKPSVVTTPAMLRAAAKSSALIEATGDYFTSLANQIQHALLDVGVLGKTLFSNYLEYVGKEPENAESPLNQLLVDRYKGLVSAGTADFEAWLQGHSYIGDLIRERSERKVAFGLPAILLVYYAVATEPRNSRRDCPLSDADLEPIYTDLGKAF
jgi:putative GTP pyrophosphokinase